MRLSRRSFSTGLLASLALAPRAAALAAPAIAPEVLRSDLDELFERLKRAHFDLFAHRSRAAHEAEHARLRRRFDRPMRLDEAINTYQRFVAFGRVAHARIDSAGDGYRAYRAAGGRIFALTLRIRDGRVFVMANAGGNSEVRPGDELDSIEGHPAQRLIGSLWQDVSADSEYMFHSMMEWDLPRLLWQRFGQRDAFTVGVRSGAASRTVRIAARTRAEIAAAVMDPPPLDASPTDRSYRLIGDRLGYFRPGPFYAVEAPDALYDNRGFIALTDEAFGHFLAAKADRLIIDLRDNPGGDSSFSDPLVGWFATRPFRFASAFRIKVSPETVASNRARLAIPGNDPTGISAQFERAYAGAAGGEVIDFPIRPAQPRSGARFEGRVFVLINRHSYSNAVNVAALVQDHGFGTVIGEETSDLATTYGAMEQFALSGTGIKIGYPKARIIRPNGSLAERGVVPDIAIETPLFEGADDPVLARAVEIARRGEIS